MSTAAVKSNDRHHNQKFWPLKKFNLHNHGKTATDQRDLQQRPAVLSPPLRPRILETPPANAKITTDKDTQKKSKNKRLSSLLSSNRRQEANSHDPQPNETAEYTKRHINTSNTPALTRKAGREIKSRGLTQQQTNKEQRNSHAKSSTFTRSNDHSSPPTHPSLNKVSFKTKESRTNGTKTTLEERVTTKANTSRPQSPTSKLNEAQQPKIMLKSVQKQIQEDQEQKMMEKNQSKEKDDRDDLLMEQKEKMEKINHSLNKEGATAHATFNMANSSLPLESMDLNPDTTEELKKRMVNTENKGSLPTCSSKDVSTQVQSSPLLPSPPVTPAAIMTSMPEFSHPIIIRDNKGTLQDAADMTHSFRGSVSPTICTFDTPSVHQHGNNNSSKCYELDKQHNNANISALNTLYPQKQPTQGIQRLRSAASFATLRQLASTNCNHQQQHQNQIQQIKKRPVSFIEPRNHSKYNYSMASVGSIPLPSDDYLSVHRPDCYRRASSEDNRNFHVRYQSDNTTTQLNSQGASLPSSNNASPQVSARRMVRSNTVHNLIIKDGQGHRIVQCVGLDDNPTLPSEQLRRQPSNYDNSDLMHLQHQQQQHQFIDCSSPLGIIDDTSAILMSRQKIEELQLQQQLLLQHHQNAMVAAVTQQQETNTDASSSDSSSHHGSNGASRNTGAHRKMRRKDSAKSLNSLCSSSPPIRSHDANFELLKAKLEKERATIKALQKQKEACNKDVLFLSKNVDDLTADNVEWRKKFEIEKTNKERFQDDLSATMDKLNEATEQIRQLESQTRLFREEIDNKNKEIRDLEKKNEQQISASTLKVSDGKPADRLLAAQLHHSQNQVKLLKSTMEQFLRMGVFNDDLHSSISSLTSPATSIDAVVSELKCGKTKQNRNSKNPASTNNHTTKSATGNDLAVDNTSDTQATAVANKAPTPVLKTRSRKSLVPNEVIETNNADEKNLVKQQTNFENRNETTPELDIQLRELMREKEILQAEYSKAPSSGGNALARRRREELESRLDTVDSQMCRIKLKMRNRNIL